MVVGTWIESSEPRLTAWSILYFLARGFCRGCRCCIRGAPTKPQSPLLQPPVAPKTPPRGYGSDQPASLRKMERTLCPLYGGLGGGRVTTCVPAQHVLLRPVVFLACMCRAWYNCDAGMARRFCAEECPRWLKGAVLKIARVLEGPRGFESHLLRHCVCPAAVFRCCRSLAASPTRGPFSCTNVVKSSCHIPCRPADRPAGAFSPGARSSRCSLYGRETPSKLGQLDCSTGRGQPGFRPD